MYLYQIQPDGSALRRWRLGDAPVIVGRSADAEVCVPDYRMSGRHFTIVPKGGAFVLEDLESKNGTWINGVRIARTGLKPGDRIVAGRTRFSCEAGLATMIQELEKREFRSNLLFGTEHLKK
jgi:pSer/pThr/pTyr-binding forkhead associated (FHA) protein